MPKTALSAKFIRVPVEGGRIRVAPSFDDYLDPSKTVVLELGMQRGNLTEEYFPKDKSAAAVAGIDGFNAACRRLGIPVIHVGYEFRPGGLDLRTAPFMRITPLSGQKAVSQSGHGEGQPAVPVCHGGGPRGPDAAVRQAA